jgi:ADP-heptose:LPS heptosyltransferase
MKRILVIRFSSIGDIVLTSAVVRCLKEQVPDAEVHFLTKKQFEPIVQAIPYIDKTWIYDKNFGELIPQLKSMDFNFIADLHRNFRSLFVKMRLGVRSGTFNKLNLRKWLAVNLKMNVLPDIHIVERYFRAVATLGVTNDGKGLDYFIPSRDEVDRSALPAPFCKGYIAVVTGGKHNTKIFPAVKVAEVCKRLSAPVILLGGPEDRVRGEEIAKLSGTLVLNACGQYNFNQSASLVRQANAVLSNDTGLMHVAAAFRKPIVSVWGNTVPEFGMYPYLPGISLQHSLVAEVQGLSCRPCSKLGYIECPKKHFRCMMDIDVAGVIGFLERWR